MEHKLTITLPDEVYQPLLDAAAEQGRTPEEVATERLAQAVSPTGVSVKNGAPSDITRYFGIWDSGDPKYADNERIDADLAREYGSSHEEE